MTMSYPISIQVNSKGVTINLNPEVDFSVLKNAFHRHVEEASDFFAGVDVFLNGGGRTF